MNDAETVMNVEFERTRINLWHIGAIIGALAVNCFTMGGVYFTMQNNDASNAKDIAEVRLAVQGETQARKDRGIITDGKFKSIEDKMPQFDVINQQILRLTELAAQNTKGIEETNRRIDRVVESQSSKLDNIVQRLSDLSSDVKVVQSQLNDQKQPPQRTRFPTSLRAR